MALAGAARVIRSHDAASCWLLSPHFSRQIWSVLIMGKPDADHADVMRIPSKMVRAVWCGDNNQFLPLLHHQSPNPIRVIRVSSAKSASGLVKMQVTAALSDSCMFLIR